MNIAIITVGVYPFSTGGSEIHTYYHAIGLEKSGHSVTVFTKISGGPRRATIGRNVSIEQAGSSIPILGQVHFILETTLRLLLRGRGFDLVHVHYATYFPVPAYLFHMITSKPFVITCHGFDINTLRKSLVWRFAQTLFFRSASIVTAASTAIREILVREYRVPREKTGYVPSGVDLALVAEVARHSPTPDKERLVMVAKLRPVKDPMTAIRAFQIVRNQIPQATMSVVGGGPLQDSISDYVAKSGIGDVVRMTGMVNHAAALRETASGGVFVLSSLEEGGNPLALIEAMALSKPVVATAVGGVVDVVRDSVNGMLVPPRSPEAMAKTVSRILRDESLARTLAFNARQTVQGLTWDVTVRSYVKIYDLLLATRFEPGKGPR